MLSDLSELIDEIQPARHPVPTRAVLVHQPPLTLANGASASWRDAKVKVLHLGTLMVRVPRRRACYGSTTLQVPKGTKGRVGHAALLLTVTFTNARGLPAVVLSAKLGYFAGNPHAAFTITPLGPWEFRIFKARVTDDHLDGGAGPPRSPVRVLPGGWRATSAPRVAPGDGVDAVYLRSEPGAPVDIAAAFTRQSTTASIGRKLAERSHAIIDPVSRRSPSTTDSKRP
jgi:hypothetical protein